MMRFNLIIAAVILISCRSTVLNLDDVEIKPAKLGDTFTNTIGQELIFIPPGRFVMGPVQWKKQDPGFPNFQHIVVLSKFYFLGATEVTQGQWERVMGNNPSIYKLGDDVPVDSVSWSDTQKFCKKLTEIEQALGKIPKSWEYRLPTLAEWEYAARAGVEIPPNIIWNDISFNEKNSYKKPHKVSKKNPNAWGFYDMIGNVSEWCQYAFNYEDNILYDPQGDPRESMHPFRGSNWNYRANNTSFTITGYMRKKGKLDLLGFRICLSPIGQEVTTGDGNRRQ